MYFYPKLKELIHKYINNCETCNMAKYDRKPSRYKFEISETPSEPNEILHGDLFFCYKQVFLTLLDKFTKHLMVQRLNDRNAITIIQSLQNRFSIFGKPKKIVFDNEFNSLRIKDFLREENIQVHFTSPRSHTGNSPIERVHGTLNEHLRILEAQKSKASPLEKVLFATECYNNTIHSVTQEKPIDFLKNKISNLSTVKQRLEIAKIKLIGKLNQNRIEFNPQNENEIFIENPEAVRYKHLHKYVKIKPKLVNNKFRDIRNNNIHPTRIKRKFKFFSENSNPEENQTNSKDLPGPSNSCPDDSTINHGN